MRATDLFVWGVAAHLAADWIFQNEWVAVNKVNVKHPAAWLHSAMHLFWLALVFPWVAALVLAVSHLWIDTRVPLQWWRKRFEQTTEGPMAIHVAIWGDQVFHVEMIALMALWVGGKP